jgi:hypothetical protein
VVDTIKGVSMHIQKHYRYNKSQERNRTRSNVLHEETAAVAPALAGMSIGGAFADDETIAAASPFIPAALVLGSNEDKEPSFEICMWLAVCGSDAAAA